MRTISFGTATVSSPQTDSRKEVNSPLSGEPKGLLSHLVDRFAFDLFAMTMGTGVVSLMLPKLSPSLAPAGKIVWLFNIALFLLLSSAGAAKFVSDRKGFFDLFKDSKRSMFFGTLPMGLATIGNGTLLYGSTLFGKHFVGASLGIYLADAAIAVASGFIVPHLMFTTHEHSMDRMTAIWLLPIVPAEVTSVSGGLLIPHLSHPGQIDVLWSSFLLWTLSVPVAMLVLGAVLMRLVIHGIPESNSAVTSWLTLGPLGTGSAGMVLLGGDAKSALAHTALASVGPELYGTGLVLGLTLWGFGLWWWISSIALSLRYIAQRNHPFNLGWWGFTFPLGVMNLATYLLGVATNFSPITILAKFMTVTLLSLWAAVASLSLIGFLNGTLPVEIAIREDFYSSEQERSPALTGTDA